MQKLGTGKRQLVAVNFLGNLCVTALSLAIGLVLGIALSKFAELGLVRLVGGDTDFPSVSTSRRWLRLH